MPNIKTCQFTILTLIFCTIGCVGKSRIIDATTPNRDHKQYLAEIIETTAARPYLSGKTKLKISSPEKNFTAKAIFFIKRPASLHVEILNFFNQPQLFLITDPDQLQMYIPAENKLFYGNPSPENFSRIIGMPIIISDFISVITFNIPQVSLEQSKMIINENDDHMIYTLIKDKETTEIWVDRKLHKITRFINYKDQSRQLEINYSSFTEIEKSLVPASIDIQMPQDQCRLLVDFSSFDFNSFSDDLFRLTLPHNIRVFTFPDTPTHN